MAYRHIHEYYDIDEILASDQRVPVVFQHDARDLGWMDEQNMDERDLPADARVELPWWLACQLAGRNSVTLDLPQVFQPAWRTMMLAAPAIIDLGLGSDITFLYEFGIMYADLIRELEIGSMLCAMMDVRYKEIVRRAVNRKQTEAHEFTMRLSNMERKLYDAKASGLLQQSRFFDRSAIRLTIAPVLASLQYAQRHNANSSSAAAAANAIGTAATRNALRNITNEANATRTPNPSSSAATKQTQSRLTQPSTSTLANLTAQNASNQPLPTTGRRKYGLAATQEREAQAQRAEAERAEQANRNVNETRMTGTQNTQQAQAQRKRKMVQQNL